MREISISNEAVDRADLWSGQIPRSDLRASLAAAAPLILAAELEDLADGLCCGNALVERATELRAKADPTSVTVADRHGYLWCYQDGEWACKAVARRYASPRALDGARGPIHTTPAAVTPEPAGPRDLRAWQVTSTPWNSPSRELPADWRYADVDGKWCVQEDSGGWAVSAWSDLKEMQDDGYTLTEVPAVPPAEPGAGA